MIWVVLDWGLFQTKLVCKIFGSWVEYEDGGFFVFPHIRITGKVTYVRDLQCPAGLYPPKGARNREEDTVKILS